MEDKKYSKLELALDIAKNTPKALFELGLYASTFGGTATAAIGTPIAYLYGNYELAENLGLWGSFAGGMGLTMCAVFCPLLVEDSGISEILEDIHYYNYQKRNKK